MSYYSVWLFYNATKTAILWSLWRMFPFPLKCQWPKKTVRGLIEVVMLPIDLLLDR